MESLNKIKVQELSDYYVRQLVQAWIEYKKLIIYVDFDQTILAYEPFEKELCQIVIEAVQEAKKLGAIVALYTCRDGQLLAEALQYCESQGLEFDMINPIERFKETYSTKPYYNILLDDKAGLLSAVSTLVKAISLYKQWLSEIPAEVELCRSQIATLLSEYEINN